MMIADVNCIYCSCSCNKTPHAIDWGFNDLICYGACNAIHLYKYEENSVPVHYQTLSFHKKIITSVHWIKNNKDSEKELVATSADLTASIWTLKDSTFSVSTLLEGHTGIISNASSIYLQQENSNILMVATVSIDSTLKLWKRNEESETSCIQTISFGSGFALDLKFSTLSDNNEVILLVGTDDSKIRIYVQDGKNNFVPSVTLKGHQDWIQSIDIIRESSTEILIASGSQDNFIRIWKISKYDEHIIKEISHELKIDSIIFSTYKDNTYSVSLESVLSGHENWIYSVKWRRHRENDGKHPFQILSASMDKTIIIWEYDTNSNIWIEKVRLGEVGGNTLGFYGAVFSSQGNMIIAHGYQGAIHAWKLNRDNDVWQPALSFGGHYSAVQDIDWDPDGEYLLSCSFDQTTRLHAPFSKSEKVNWYEIARPQVHGYDMVCLSILNRFKFISSGDEKVLRVFEAPRSFAEILNNLTHLNVESYVRNKMAEGASVPSLGLSNKAVFEEDILKANDSLKDQNAKKNFKDQYPDFYYNPMHIAEPPTEETLLQNTLWPETQKLYGHPYEVFTVASNHSKTLVASACKASKVEHAGIILWCTSTWKQVAYLPFHTLTVTQIEFSPNDEYLLSVSRDRMWAIYKHFQNNPIPYQKIANLDKKLGIHTRIIWSCSWTSDSVYFATASRDKKIAIWSKREKNSSEEIEGFSLSSEVLEVADSATAVSFAPKQFEKRYILAIGLENGSICLYSWSEINSWNLLLKLNQNVAHHLNVNRLKFSPIQGEAGSKQKNSSLFQLASCGNDHHVKIYNVCIAPS